jgi:chitin-binding protein
MPDLNGVHPGAVHFSTVADHDAFRIDQHYAPPGAVDYDVKVQDRLRCEVKGMRAGGVNLSLLSGQTWRLSWSLLVPSSLRARPASTISGR